MRDSYVQLTERRPSIRVTQINQQTQQIEQVRPGAGVGTVICFFGVVLGAFSLAFIIPNLIYAYQGSECVNVYVSGIAFNLATWLKVDSFVKILIISLLLLGGLITCISLQIGTIVMKLVIFLTALYTLFSFAWTVVGSVLFWGKLLPLQICSGGIQAYMYAYLIISYIGIICNTCFTKNSSDSFL